MVDEQPPHARAMTHAIVGVKSRIWTGKVALGALLLGGCGVLAEPRARVVLLALLLRPIVRTGRRTRCQNHE